MRLTFETRFFILPDPSAPHTDRAIYEKEVIQTDNLL